MAEEIRLKNGGEITPPRDGKKRHYWWRYLLCFVAGTLFPGILIGSAIAIGGTVMTTRDIFNMIGISPDEYLSEQYQNTTVLQLVMSISQKKFETLGDIYEVTPFIKKVYDEKISTVLEDFVHATFTWEEVSDKKFVPGDDGNIELFTFIGDELPKRVTIASFLGDTSSMDPLMLVFLYGEDDVPYTIADFMADGFFDDLMTRVTLHDLVPSLDIKLSEMTLKELTTITPETLTINKIIDIYEEDVYDGETLIHEKSEPILIKLGGVSLADLQSGGVYNSLKTLKLNELLPIDEGSDAILQKLGDLTIDQLSSSSLFDQIKDVKISEFFPSADSSAILKLFGSDFTIGMLTESESVNGLSLSPLFEDELAKANPNPVIKALFGDPADPTTIGNIGDKISSITLYQVLTIEPGSILDKEAIIDKLKTTTLSNADDLIDIVLDEIYLNEIMDKESSFVKGMDARSNTVYGHDAKVSELEDLMKFVEIGDIVDTSTHPILAALAGVKIFGDSSDLTTALNAVTIGELYGDGEFSSDPIMSQIWPEIKDSTLTDLPTDMANAFKKLKLIDMLGDQIYKTGSGAKSRNAIKVSYTLKDTDLMKTGDVITGVNPTSDGALLGNSIYSALESKIISGLDAYEIAKLGGSGVEFVLDKHSGNYYLNYVPADTSYAASSDATNMDYVYNAIKESTSVPTYDGTTVTFDRGGYTITVEAYEAKEIDGSFWYLFTETSEKFNSKNSYFVTKQGQTYTVDSDFDQMVNNFKDHMQTEKIRDLVKAGFINEISDEKLDSPLTIQTALGPVKPDPTHNLGDYTLQQLFDLILNLSI